MYHYPENDPERIVGYGFTEWIHEDSCPTREYYELCPVCATPLQREHATARITRAEAREHNSVCAICHRYLDRIYDNPLADPDRLPVYAR